VAESGRVLISLFGAAAGQGVICYTAQFYVALALLLGMAFFTLFGALSDRIGTKWLMACLLSIVSYIRIYKQTQVAAGNNIATVRSTTNKLTGAINLTPLHH
jgi:MFS family permease